MYFWYWENPGGLEGGGSGERRVILRGGRRSNCSRLIILAVSIIMSFTAVPVRRELHPIESAGVGALSGIIEVLLQQPSVSIKNFIQDKKPINFDPRVLYRGVAVNATSIAPIIAIQFGLNNFLQRSLTSKPTAVQIGAMAGAAGMVSSICSAPAELLMIQQQRSGLNFLTQAQTVANKHGWFSLFRGLSSTAVREGFFTASYLGIKPLMEEELSTWAGGRLTDRPTLTTFLAAAASGVLAAVVTHPFDTIKTRMQSNLDLPNYRTVTSTAKTLWWEGGIRQLYAGILPRTQRVVCAVYIYGEAKTHLTSLYFKALTAETDAVKLNQSEIS